MHALTQCPQCETKAKVPIEAIGRQVRCPGCKGIYDAAFLAEAVETPAASSSSVQIQPNPTPPPPVYSPDETETPEENTDLAPRPWAPFPGVVRAAGIIWIVFGGLIILAFLLVMLVAAVRSGRGAQGDFFGGLVCGGSLIALLAGGFIFVGVQTIRGTARDTLGNAIGSILFAAVIALVSIAPMINVRGDPGFQIVTGLFVFLEVIGLVLGGILALAGRADYKAWRRINRPRPPKLDWQRLDKLS